MDSRANVADHGGVPVMDLVCVDSKCERLADCTRVAPHLSRDVPGTPEHSEDRERTPPIINMRTDTNFEVLRRTRGMKFPLPFNP